jgi:hypothetical protein
LEWNYRCSFLALAYFGTDQSQVGRYLSGGKSVRESQMGLIMNGLLKVPMQFLFAHRCYGICVFQFNPVPLNFNPNMLLLKIILQRGNIVLET